MDVEKSTCAKSLNFLELHDVMILCAKFTTRKLNSQISNFGLFEAVVHSNLILLSFVIS